MKNREWFQNTATIDRLMQMNKRLVNTNKGVCILNSLISDEGGDKEINELNSDISDNFVILHFWYPS